MNREETKKAIEVMQAYVDGKGITNYDGDVLIADNGDLPAWNWDFRSLGLSSYAIKPEPIERWMAIWNREQPYLENSQWSYQTKRKCEISCQDVDGFIKAIKLVEEI